MESPRTPRQRKIDTLHRLDSDVDAWIASADADGAAYLLPLSFLWDGTGIIISTPESSITARNLTRSRRVRVGIGEVRDVVLIDGIAEPVHDDSLKDAFVAKHGWDPRAETGNYAWFRIVADRIQAWREVNELTGRTLMRAGAWTTD